MNSKTLEMEFPPLILGCDRLVDGYGRMKQSDVGGANRERGVVGNVAVDSGVVQHGAGVLVSWSDISCHAAHWTGHQTHTHTHVHGVVVGVK